jgi:hypothetical protein
VQGQPTTTHTVPVTRAYWQELTCGRSQFEKSFEFLLERESNARLLRSFEMPLIQRYFPDYGRTMGGNLG